jgi:hypothetical protein
LKYKTLHHTARHIDHLIDHHLNAKDSSFIPQEGLKKLVTECYPDIFFIGYGWHKIVFGVHSENHKIVLKVGAKKTIENDHRAYKRVPDSVRHRLFAHIFWHTKYCLLQEYGFPTHVTSAQLTRIRLLVYKYGIFDIKPENLKKIDGAIKIIDANVTRIPLPTVIRKLDEAKPKLPNRLVSVARKLAARLGR